MADQISSLSDGYVTGMLSVFPQALDDYESLYRATNNAQIKLKQTLTYNSRRIIVEDTSLFPPNGIIRIGGDIGTGGEFENYWNSDKHYVSNAVFAEHHNAIKDAILNMLTKTGLKDFPDAESLNGILKAQEIRFLAPKPLFRAFPIKGPPPLKVRFQNFTTGHVIRYLWDFGDGGTSLEKSPIHTYLTEGFYSVKLNVVTSTGAQGVVTKIQYIEVNSDEAAPFFYVDSIDNPYSQQTATTLGEDPKEFVFVDQSDGEIVQRNWIFGDGETHTEEDPDIHEVSHIYSEPGEYAVSELIQFANGRLKRVELPEALVVL